MDRENLFCWSVLLPASSGGRALHGKGLMASSPAERDGLVRQQKEYVMVDVPESLVTASWRKSSASGNANDGCVQITFVQGCMWVRDSKDPISPVLRCPREQWTAFMAGLRCDELGRFETPAR